MIPQKVPIFGEEEASSCYKYIKSGGFLTEFKLTETFENMICQYTGAKHCICTTSGTAAINMVFKCLNLKNKNVLVPNLTMIATPNAIKDAGYNPIFSDVDLTTHTINQPQNTDVGAIVHVSLNGKAGNLDKIIKFCNENNIILVEDAAQSLGSFYNGKHLGTFGKVGIISFSHPKIISTGQGGAVVTDDDELAFNIRKFKDFGRISGGLDIHDSFGMNYKFTDLQASIGIEQMKKLPDRVEKMRQIFKWYVEEGLNIEQVNQIGWTPWFIEYKTNTRDELFNYLKDNQVQSRKFYPPICDQTIYNSNEIFENSKSISYRTLWLPSSINLSKEDVKYIVNLINAFEKSRNT